MFVSKKLRHPHKMGVVSLIVAITIWIVLYYYLTELSDLLTNSLFGFGNESQFRNAFQFFSYEVPKVFLLLILIIWVVGFLRTYFSPEKTRQLLQGKSLFTGNIMAALLGIITPFCSCSAIPLFLGFVEAGIPLGVTFSFLIAAPVINEIALVMLAGLFGWKIAGIYVLSGLIIAVAAGWIIGRLHLERYVAQWVYETHADKNRIGQPTLALSERMSAGYATLKEILSKIWIYILLGIAVGAGVHGYVPDQYLSSLLGNENWYSIPLAIVLGVPMYSNAAGIIPVVSAFIEKGVSVGTALAFMLSVIALSLPEIIILKKVLKWQLIAVFISVVTIGILIVGFIFNHLLSV